MTCVNARAMFTHATVDGPTPLTPGAAHADLVHQYRAEPWLHCGTALDVVGDRNHARKVLETGRP